ncbi:MAG: iron ABC transporter permease [Alphaproteobacteria bacterium]|nr:iron ABC transporter permease [Alphaproteobacteria bacterium]MDE2112246.1 iron ABC transporter permease [Alphaproteobacteria bacterium]
MIAALKQIYRRTPGFLLILLFVFLTLYPVARFLLLPLFPSFGPAGGMSLAVSIPVDALINSVCLGLASTLLALPFGVAIAWLFERRLWRGTGALMAVLWLIFVTPSYLMTTGWQIVFAQPQFSYGIFAQLFFSKAGIVFLLAIKGLPFAALAARTSWRALGAEIGDAARLLIEDGWARRGVVLQLLLPSAGAAFAVVFIESIQEFGIPATLGAQIHLPIVTYAIYERLATTPVDFGGASALSWLLVGLAVIAATIHQYFSARYSGALVHGRRRAVHLVPPSLSGGLLAWLGLAILTMLGVVIPGIAIVAAAVNPVGYLFPIPWDSLFYSSIYAVLAALAAVMVAVPMLVQGRSGRNWFATAMGAISLGNMAVPGLVLGAAYTIAFNSAWLPLYGTPLLLIIAYVAMQVPMLIRFLQAPVEHLHLNLSDAARLHGLPWAMRVFDIDGPLLAPAFTWGWMLAFGQIFFELPISELLYPAGRAPVAVALVWLNQNLHYTEEARLALAGIGITFLITGAVSAAVSVVLRSSPSGALA